MTIISSLYIIESGIIELKDKFLSKGGDKVLKHYELNHFDLPFNFLDRNLESTNLIDIYLNLLIDFNLEYLPNPY
jgi:tRNA splicing ligase